MHLTKNFIIFFLGIMAVACMTAGFIFYKSREIAPLVYHQAYPLVGVCLLVAGIILVVAFVFKMHHSHVPAFDMVKAYLCALATLFVVWYVVTPLVGKFLHKVYRQEVKAEITKRVRSIFGLGAKKQKEQKKPDAIADTHVLEKK